VVRNRKSNLPPKRKIVFYHTNEKYFFTTQTKLFFYHTPKFGFELYIQTILPVPKEKLLGWLIG
jgi:hypothetical protein